jgi:uncharacterized protein YndB with AHSA1/START domain
MVPNRIERDILIDAPVDVVWAVVTEPEHISGWFSDSVELELRPGGAAVLHWDAHGSVHGRVERVEPPRFFSFRWAVKHGEGFDEANATLVEFSLSAEGESTRLTVVESGFSELDVAEPELQQRFDDHVRGWRAELGDLARYLRQQAGTAAEG